MSTTRTTFQQKNIESQGLDTKESNLKFYEVLLILNLRLLSYNKAQFCSPKSVRRVDGITILPQGHEAGLPLFKAHINPTLPCS